MSFTVPGQNFNLGVDRSILLIDQFGNQYNFSTLTHDLMSFKSEPMTSEIQNKSISRQGIIGVEYEYHAWTGEFVVNRKGNDLETLQYKMEQAYQNGDDPYVFTIHESTRNRDGSGTTSKWRYDNVKMTMTQDGDWKLETEVELTFKFHAETKTPE
jgi:hypothetical protein